MLEPPAPRHPNGGTVQPVIIAHDADSRFTRQRILAQIVRAGQHFLFALFHSQQGVWGSAPCLPVALDVPRPNAENAEAAGAAKFYCPANRERSAADRNGRLLRPLIFMQAVESLCSSVYRAAFFLRYLQTSAPAIPATAKTSSATQRPILRLSPVCGEAASSGFVERAASSAFFHCAT